jgi:uncharacterized protein (TIGR00725 family)
MRISVVGGGSATPDQRDIAREVGRLVGERCHDLVCGGRGGSMAAACEGAKQADGRTVGILPGVDRSAANEYVDVAVATGLGHARNALVAMNGDAVVALAGGPGTLTEIGYAAIFDRPVAGVRTHDVPAVEAVETPAAAVAYVEDAVDGPD